MGNTVTNALDKPNVRDKAKTVGKHAIGRNLRLDVERRPDTSLRQTYVFRYTITARTRELTLGDYAKLTLSAAQAEADRLRGLVRQGIDPLAEREATRTANLMPVEAPRTFGEAVAGYIDAQKANVRPNTLRVWNQCQKHFDNGKVCHEPTSNITRALVIEFLKTFWDRHTISTGLTVRLMGELAWNYAVAHNWTSDTTANPWQWALLKHTLRKAPDIEHYPAVPYERVPAVYRALVAAPGIAARAVRFAILTASRPSEVRDLTWREIDLRGGLWTLPASRDKTKHKKSTPLTAEALACLGTPGDPDALVFPGRTGRSLVHPSLAYSLRKAAEPCDADKTVPATARSSFSDWGHEETDFAELTTDYCLGHRVGGSKGAYYRREAVAKRRVVLDAWATYLTNMQAVPAPATPCDSTVTNERAKNAATELTDCKC